MILSVIDNKEYLDQYIMRVLDPVCGIELDDDLAVTAEYDGSVYYFCCDGCKKIFLKNPKKYKGNIK